MFFEKWNDFCRSMVKTHIQVAQKNIRDIRSIIYSSLSDKNLGRALAQLKIIARPCHAEELSEIEDNYHIDSAVWRIPMRITSTTIS